MNPAAWSLNEWFGAYTLGLWILIAIAIILLGRG